MSEMPPGRVTDVCVRCGQPVLLTSWFSKSRGHCLLRALGQDCIAEQKMIARRKARRVYEGGRG
jgi:hypothetical protein